LRYVHKKKVVGQRYVFRPFSRYICSKISFFLKIKSIFAFSKKAKMRFRYLFIVAVALFTACSGRIAKVKGRLVLCSEESVYLDIVSPTGTRTVDSVRTDKRGNYRFKVELPGGHSAIYNIRCSGGAIPLVLAPGERVEVKSMGKPTRNYTVQGSEGSERMYELNQIILSGVLALDSITDLYSRLESGQDSLRRRIAGDYARQYYKTKQEQVRFIVSYPRSLAAFYALYQRLPNDKALFNGDGDVIYYQLVADSLSAAQPESPYLAQLQREIESFGKNIRLQQLLDESSQQELNYPDLELSDMYGNRVRLSSLHGKVILLDFWLAANGNCKLNNAEMKEWYGALCERGFEIYQVSLDTSKPLWVTTVQTQKLPWISVSDLRGAAGMAAKSYNVTTLPTNYLIDRNGNIVSRDLFGDSLLKRVKELL